MLGRWGVRLHPFKPPGQDCFQASQLSEQWLPHTWVSMPVWVFPCNPISDSSHKGLHLPVLWFLLPLLAAMVSLGKCELVTEETASKLLSRPSHRLQVWQAQLLKLKFSCIKLDVNRFLTNAFFLYNIFLKTRI